MMLAKAWHAQYKLAGASDRKQLKHGLTCGAFPLQASGSQSGTSWYSGGSHAAVPPFPGAAWQSVPRPCWACQAQISAAARLLGLKAMPAAERLHAAQLSSGLSVHFRQSYVLVTT